MLSLERETVELGLEQVPGWVAEHRRAGFEAFSGLSMPAGEEVWKYIDLDFDVRAVALARGPGDPMAGSPYAGGLAASLIVDGAVVSVADSPEGVSVTPFRQAIADSPDLARRATGWGVPPDDIFAAAHQAFGSDGLLIHAGRGVASAQPVVIEIQSTIPDSISFPHVGVWLEDNAELHLIVVQRSVEGFVVVVPVVEVVAGDGARLRMTTVQNWGRGTTGVAYQRVRMGRDADVKTGEVGLGGALGRLDIGFDLDGNGSNCEIFGVSFGDQTQVMDYRMVINHRGKNTSSNVFLKGAVEDQAESVFTGLLRIAENATNTSAFEKNRNLVLSEGAKAHSVPNLEILCDDVVCGHGSTVGPLEEEHLYYLRSRGLSQERAERLLVRGFFEEIIARLPASVVAEPVRQAVYAKFIEAQAEGRV
ncbi:MAG: Fe-S cluster assembly protein SufD [Acidimicrobiia bacterium]|nr:Fe-S cluster assembly protein SufD [Acidimicrobiia bacterium]